MTITQIQAWHKKNFPDSVFFDEKRLSECGESLDTMRVLNNQCVIETDAGKFACFQVCSGIAGTVPRVNVYHYFDILSFEWIATKKPAENR